jgi:8-oxo-dGTP pyrophosphatase MutT (NUDIX family)
MDDYVLPRVPASAGALLRDDEGRILILKPTYKSGWTVPGGQLEEDGESPWEGCRREVREETGLDVVSGRLACVDFLRPRPGRPGGIRFLFDCGVVDVDVDRRGGLVLQVEEISEARWAPPDEALRLLSGPVGRRVARALAATGTVYLESGRPVPGVDGW